MSAKLRVHAAPATVVFLVVIVALVVVGLVVLSGAEAADEQPKCGDTITTDTTLHRNLVNCPNNGIIIGADDVTLDLNYHRIDGDGTPAGGCNPETEFCDIGVLSDGHDGVTVMHGSVREFDVGAVVGEARHNRLLGISSSRNLSFGIVVFDSARSLVRGSSGNRNLPPEGDGMGLFSSHHVRIVHNSFRRNPQFGPGLHVADSSHNLIKGNVFSRNPDVAISLENADRNRVKGNRCVRNGACIGVGPGNRNVIARNRVAHARPSESAEGVAIVVDGGDRNVIANNSVRDVPGRAISVGFIAAVGNVVRGNDIRGAGEDGVHVVAKAKHTLLRRNRVRHAKDDGFDVEGRRSKVTRNEARRNGDLGIEAVRGVIDGGGNKASGNGDPRQCTHIACS
jgi:parallel beta-helix repeat protein